MLKKPEFLSGRKARKVRKLSKIFSAVAASVFGIAYAANSITSYANDETDDLLQRVSMTEQQLDDVTDANFNVIYVDSDAGEFFSYTTLSPGIIDIVKDHNAQIDNQNFFNAYAYKIPIIGEGEFLDTVTFGLSGTLLPATVLFPSESPDLDSLFSVLSGFERSYAANLESTAEDFLRLVFLHEIAHTEIQNWPNHMKAELRADQGAFEKHKELDGEDIVLQEWVYMRTATSVQLFMHLYQDQEYLEEFKYVMGPILQAELHGQDAMTVEQSKAVHYEAGAYLNQYAESKGLHVPFNAERLGDFIQYMLSDAAYREHNPLGDQAVALFDLYLEATEHFTRKSVYDIEHKAEEFIQPQTEQAEDNPAFNEMNRRKLGL